MGQLDTVQSIMAIGVILVGVVSWFIRQESAIKSLERRVDDLAMTHKEKDTAFWTKMDDMQKSINSLLQIVGRIEGKLENERK